MRKPWLILSALPVFTACISGHARADSDGDFVSGELLVGFRDGARVNARQWRDSGHNAAVNAIRVKVDPFRSLQSIIASLRRDSNIAYVEPNFIRRITASPNDPLYVHSQYAPQRVKADKAWDAWQPKAAIVIAIIDTGIDYNHNDLKNVLLRDTSGNVVGYNALTKGTNANDDNGHGTHVAGIAASQINNGIGTAGVAAWNPGVANSGSFVRLMPVKVLNSSGSGADSGIADGITWAANRGAKIINLSLGSQNYSHTVNNAVQYAWSKGCVIVGSAGNKSSTTKFYPAAYDNVISVAATDSLDTLSYFSNHGSWIKTAAPGSSILSTYKGDYARFSGTSMASPHVSGGAAILMSHSPGITNSQTSALITGNCDSYNLYLGRSIASGAGRINIQKALTALSGQTFSVSSSTHSITSGAAMSVSWAAPLGRPSSDWVALFREGDPNTVYGWWKFTNGASTGSYNLNAPSQPGSYQFRYLLENGHVEAARSATIAVEAPASDFAVSAFVGTVTASGSMSVSWTAPAGRPATDWIGIYKVGDPNTAYGWWKYTSGTQSGNFTLTAPASAGLYEFRYLLQDHFTLAAKSGAFSVIAAPTNYSLSVGSTANSSVTVSWSAPSGRPTSDWIGLYKVGDPNTAYGWWRYTGGAPSGSFQVTMPSTAGTYEFRYLLQDGFTVSARSSPIIVGS